MKKYNIMVGIVIGSKSDKSKVTGCTKILKEFGISYETNIISAHRTPNKAVKYAKEARSRGIEVIIAAAGLSAALPGVLASYSDLPVIGIPIATGVLNGIDALYSIVQLPEGVPVAAVGIDNAKNAALLAARIIALGDKKLQNKIENFKRQFGDIP